MAETDIAPLRNKSEVVFEVYSGPDGQGRHGFIMHWWCEGFHTGPCKRGQVFLANMDEHRKSWEARGRQVRIIQEADNEKALGARRRRRRA